MYSLYRIGIEVEFMLKPLAVQFSASEKLRTIVDRIISACNPQLRASAQLRNRVDKSCSRPEHWSLKKDNSVIAYEWNAVPLELVSPILDYNETNAWRDDLRDIFRALSTACDIEVNSTCGVHVHISRAMAPWKLQTLKELCRNIFYFEDVINTLVPDHRLDNEMIESSRRGSEPLQGKPPCECVRIVNKCVSTPHLVRVMNNYGSRYFAWNLTNMTSGNRKTVEFRQPPGANTAEPVLQWAEFVVLFLHAAMRSVSFEQLSQIPRSLSGLFYFLSIHMPLGYDTRAVEELLSASFKSKQLQLAAQAEEAEKAREAEEEEAQA